MQKPYDDLYAAQHTYGTHVLPITVVCRYKNGRFGDHGLQRFAYVTLGQLKMTPHQVADEYRRRFGVETSYCLMNTLRAHTTSDLGSLALVPGRAGFVVAQLVSLRRMAAFVRSQT